MRDSRAFASLCALPIGAVLAASVCACSGGMTGSDTSGTPSGTYSPAPAPSPGGSASSDGGASTSASPPAGGTGAADDGGPVGVDASSPSAPGATAPCNGAAICEDFEELAAGALALPDAGSRWQVETPDCSGTGAIAVDTSQSHSGTRSLKVTGAAGYCNHVFLGTNAVASLSGQLWARFFVRLSTPLTTDHATFLAMHDVSGNSDLRMGGQDSVLMWNRQSDDATLPAMSPQGTALSISPSANAWHCIELAVSAAGPTLSTWVDGALVSGLVVGGSAAVATADGQWISNTAWSPHLVDARFGWESYAGEAETLWFDDLAIGTTRIGCGG